MPPSESRCGQLIDRELHAADGIDPARCGDAGVARHCREELDLVDEPAEAPPAERHELGVGKTTGLVPHYGRHENLVPLGFRNEARGDVHGRPHVVALAIEHRAVMDAAAHRREQGLAGDEPLDLERAGDGRARRWEHDHERVPDLLDDPAVPNSDGLADDVREAIKYTRSGLVTHRVGEGGEPGKVDKHDGDAEPSGTSASSRTPVYSSRCITASSVSARLHACRWKYCTAGSMSGMSRSAEAAPQMGTGPGSRPPSTASRAPVPCALLGSCT